MADFLLELGSEEIPARMQAAAAEQLRVRFGDGIEGRVPGDIAVTTWVTPRRLALYATGLGAHGNTTVEERRGPRADAPAAAIEGFLRGAGLTRDQLEERDTPKGRFLYATIRSEGRPTADLLAELVPAIVRDFDWPKSMRWGAASISTASPRWVRPLTHIIALFDDEVVPFEAAGIASGRTTRGHRFLSDRPVEIAHARDYAETLRRAFVLVDPVERRARIADGAAAAAAAAGLSLLEDPGLLDENAGLTEWPVPLLGRFDPAFLDVPREVIQLTMRTNQKYFAAANPDGSLAPAFVCVANLDATDGGAAIIAGNERVLSARLSDAKFFWDADVAKVKNAGLEAFTPKLADIVFHERLGTLAQKVERVARLARWLVETSVVPDADPDLAENAAFRAKADLVSATVGEFPEMQGIAGRYLAIVAGEDPRVANAIRDHYRPVGASDAVPTDPVSIAVALADKLDTMLGFFCNGLKPTGSRDPFALRRAGLSIIALLTSRDLRISLRDLLDGHVHEFYEEIRILSLPWYLHNRIVEKLRIGDKNYNVVEDDNELWIVHGDTRVAKISAKGFTDPINAEEQVGLALEGMHDLVEFLIDRLKVQQREAGVRHDLIDAVFALGGEDDLVRLLARVKALQRFVETPDGANLLAGYKRAANILRIEEAKDGPHDGSVDPALLAEPAEQALAAALAAALPQAEAAVAAEDFAGAMAALAALRPAVDAFFDAVIVNADDPAIRANRLNLLNSLRQAMHKVADFSKIEG